jgi:hypothetical protein
MVVQPGSLLRCFTGKSNFLALSRCCAFNAHPISYQPDCSILSLSVSYTSPQFFQMSSLTRASQKAVQKLAQPSIDVALKRGKRDAPEVEPSLKKLKKENNPVILEEAVVEKTAPRKPVSDEVNQNRVRILKQGDAGKIGPVIYWVSRDQRSQDNWALLHAIQEANKKGAPVAVVFNLVDNFLDAKARHFGFMLRGLRVLEKNLAAYHIPFFLFRVRQVSISWLVVKVVDVSRVFLCRKDRKAQKEMRGNIVLQNIKGVLVVLLVQMFSV